MSVSMFIQSIYRCVLCACDQKKMYAEAAIKHHCRIVDGEALGSRIRNVVCYAMRRVPVCSSNTCIQQSISL